MKSFSIITLTYNNYELLNTAFQSLSTQSFPASIRGQLIILDDATKNLNKNNIVSLIEKYNLDSKYDIKVIINKTNIGTVRSFNKAISESYGDIILPLSADDMFYDNLVITDILNYFSDHNHANIVTCLRAPIANNLELSPLPPYNTWKQFETPKKLYEHIISKGNIISGASTYYRRVFLQKNMFDESYRYIEDFPFYLKSLKSGEKIYLFNRLSIKYSVNGISSVINKKSVIYHDYIKIWENIINENKKKGKIFQRFVYFNHILTNDEKRLINNKILYFEQSLFRYMYDLFKKIKAFLR